MASKFGKLVALWRKYTAIGCDCCIRNGLLIVDRAVFRTAKQLRNIRYRYQSLDCNENLVGLYRSLRAIFA